jgi:hypothetical protein
MLTADHRAILFLCCLDHRLACGGCRREYLLRQLRPDDAGVRRYCPTGGHDLAEAIQGHIATCVYFVSRKPLARLSPGDTAPTRQTA